MPRVQGIRYQCGTGYALGSSSACNQIPIGRISTVLSKVFAKLTATTQAVEGNQPHKNIIWLCIMLTQRFVISLRNKVKLSVKTNKQDNFML